MVNDTLKSEISAELKELKKLNNELKKLIKEIDIDNPPKTYINSFALIVHSFYCGIEKIFKRIAAQADGKVPNSKNWHKILLNKMSEENKPARGIVISRDLSLTLQRYLAFRHLVRNMYVFKLDWYQFKPLVVEFNQTYLSFKNEIQTFLKNR